MAKTWVLDTETKGTGAQMVPLEKVLRRAGPEEELNVVSLPRPQRPKPAPEVSPPRRFRVVDVMTRGVLAEGADATATVALLEEVASVVDVTVSVWEPKASTWRALTFPEQRALWDFRGRRGRPTAG